MAIPVYSIAWFRASGLTTPHSFTVPTGITAVLRHGAFWYQGSTSGAQLFVQNSMTMTMLYQTWVTGQLHIFYWDGRIVVPGPDTITISSGGAPWDVYISGYQLTSP